MTDNEAFEAWKAQPLNRLSVSPEQVWNAALAWLRSQSEPLFWVHLTSDGGYEGLLHNDRIERVRKLSGAWHPLFLAPQVVECDDREYLSAISRLGSAMRRLVIAARTSGGTAGPDEELMAACAQAEDAMTVGAIGRAMIAPQPAIPNRVVNAITVILADAMAQAVENGADSRSMPDEYVEVAAWLAKLPDDTDPQPAIPDGWKLVPVEPTPSMIWAAAELSGYPGTSEKYRAMLNAAPEPRK